MGQHSMKPLPGPLLRSYDFVRYLQPSLACKGRGVQWSFTKRYDSIPVLLVPMAGIHITDIEAAINYWRQKNPSPDGVALPRELRALAEIYALMVYYKEDEADEFTLPLAAAEAWQVWYASTPDTPCIAICSTFQGDPECKGCGRSFEEVQMWTEMTPGEKRSVWRRITVEGTSWRFNRYAERAAEDRSLARAAAEAQVPLGFGG